MLSETTHFLNQKCSIFELLSCLSLPRSSRFALAEYRYCQYFLKMFCLFSEQLYSLQKTSQTEFWNKPPAQNAAYGLVLHSITLDCFISKPWEFWSWQRRKLFIFISRGVDEFIKKQLFSLMASIMANSQL